MIKQAYFAGGCFWGEKVLDTFARGCRDFDPPTGGKKISYDQFFL